MPMSESDPTWRIADGLEHVRIWELIEARVTLSIECVSCHRGATWPPDLIARLKVNKANRLVAIAGRIRCAACRSRYVRIGRADGGGPSPGARPDPGLKRGFTAANLDANARGAGLPRRGR